MKKSSYSSSASRRSHNSNNSIHSIHSLNEVIIEEEEEEDEKSQTILDNNDSISKLIQESMTRNKIQQENVQLKQQLLEERKKYEDEKASLIQKEISLKEENQKNNEFLESISKAIGISKSNPNFERTVLAKLRSKQLNDNEEEELYYDQETAKLKDKRIAELEIAIQEGQKLMHSMEEEFEQKDSEKNQIQNVIDNQQKTINELSSYVRQFMIACETTDSPENAIKCIQDMRRKFKRIEAFSDTKRIDDLMRQFEERRANEYGKICQQIEEQGNLIHNAIQSLQNEEGNNDSNFNSMEIYQTLQSTNKLLAERMQQLRGKKLKDNRSSSDLTNSMNKNSNSRSSSDNSMADFVDNTSERYDSKGLGPTLWIAKTREMLSLERQLIKANLRLENANRNCQCLANENLYYHYTNQNTRFPQKPLPSTLL